MTFVEGKVDLQDPISEQQYQLILSWMLFSISPKLLPTVTSCENSFEAWETLTIVFASNLRSRILSLRQRLQELQKGYKPVAEYIFEITELVDTLTLAIDKTSDSDIVLYVLASLGEDYDAFVQNMGTRESEITFTQLQGHKEEKKARTANAILAKVKIEGKDVVKTIQCQIYNRKGYGALNCFDWMNIIKF